MYRMRAGNSLESRLQKDAESNSIKLRKWEDVGWKELKLSW